jgi:hypothetical protein
MDRALAQVAVRIAATGGSKCQRPSRKPGQPLTIACQTKNYFLVVVSFLAVVSAAILLAVSVILEEESDIFAAESFAAVESAADLLSPALLQAAKAPIANTIKNFFISDCFLR